MIELIEKILKEYGIKNPRLGNMSNDIITALEHVYAISKKPMCPKCKNYTAEICESGNWQNKCNKCGHEFDIEG